MNSKLLFVFIGLLVKEAVGHGMMLEPPNRSSMWRFNSRALINYADNQNFCGGFQVQWEENAGQCGVCGDNYVDPHPQDNENTGKYGQGIIGAKYEAGSIVNTSILITANHLGHYNYSLCVLDDPTAPEPGEDCFVPLVLEDGSPQVKVNSKDYQLYNRVQLPNITCERCVLRWQYTSGNNWGVCDDGSQALGCGPQEMFRSCSDVQLV